VNALRRSFAVLLTSALLLFASLALATGVTAATIAPTTTCSNGVDNTPGLGLICEVTVVNTITPSGGSATVTVRECHGAAGDPEAACTTVTDVLTEPVTAVTQCNDSTNGGGGTLRCSVDVTNNFVGVDPGATDATVNQCNGSGDGVANTCDPFPATTSGATITQCNDSANGGTLVELTCTATGTQSPGLSVTINQCNNSTNGGGALVICSANIENNEVAGPTPTPTAASGGGATPRPTPPATDALASNDSSGTGSIPFVLAGMFLLAFIALASLRPLRGARSR
jgi:hypothetical protein